MNSKALRILEYPKILQQLSDMATSSLGKALCQSLLPYHDPAEIARTQSQTTDALSRIYKQGTLSYSGLSDVSESLKRLELGSTLSIPELLSIRKLLEVARRARTYGFRPDIEQTGTPDSLDVYFSQLSPLPSLAAELSRCLVDEAEVADDASPGLQSARRAIKLTRERIQTQLNSILQTSRTALQDNVITMRNGRYCLPVKAEYRSQFNGMIHDQSSTGSTLFIEPAAIVRLNNTLREDEIAEQKEVEKVLATLSNACAPETDVLRENQDILAFLDFTFAKARLSQNYKGSEPLFNMEGIIRIKQGRHPLIPKEKVVPIDVRLGEDFTLLVITGPNTGGKTVTLKTVGLFTLMGQAGLHIPAFDGSRLAVFSDVFADIGDEQSIEQSLSTFSSHMTNIVQIVEQATPDTLVLFDELGAGTDPTEGAALAISILSFLHRMQVRTIATTHYSELKIYALRTPGVTNGGCEFDVDTLRPTYRLLIGIPGKSNAFAISRKLGLPDYILDEAKNHLDQEKEAFEDVIAKLETSRIQMEKDQAEINTYKAQIARLKSSLESKEERLDAQREKKLQEANEEARRILEEAKAYADDAIRRINKSMAGTPITRELEAERTGLREKAKKVSGSLGLTPPPKKGRAVAPEQLQPGDRVMVNTMKMKGVVATRPNSKGDLTVNIGALKTMVNVRDLSLLPPEPNLSDKPVLSEKKTGGFTPKAFQVSPEINLIGKTVDEAIPLLDKYLDDAYLAHLDKVRVVHGRGTGALRKGVHQHLRHLSYIKTFHLGEFGEGDSGVTIVEFK